MLARRLATILPSLTFPEAREATKLYSITGLLPPGQSHLSNGAMGSRQIRQYCQVGEAAKDLLRSAIQQLGLSARAYDRILKLARTVADLSGSEEIAVEHVAEPIQYRTLDRKLWG